MWKNNLALRGLGALLVFVCIFAFHSITLAATYNRSLTIGSSGSDVTLLQNLLKADGFFTALRATGYFGTATKSAVQGYQAAHGISATGYVGPVTLASLNGAQTATTGSALTIAQIKALLAQLEAELAALLGGGGGSSGGGGGGGGSSSSGGGGGSTPPSAPAISAIATSTAQTTATVTWTTDQTSNSQVVYGTTTAYGSATSSSASVTSHSLGITGLTISTLYHFEVVSTGTGGTSTSSDGTFTTLGAAPVISAVASTTATTTATVTWTTDQAANSQVVYGLTASYGSATSSAALVTSHSIGVIGLATSTTYHFAVVSKTSGGGTSTSTDHTFTTPLCPYGSSGADGCTGAPGGSAQQSNFFASYAEQSGQTYVTRPTWNVAGVDYPVGYYGTLQSVLTASLPSGCSLTTITGIRDVSCSGSGGALDLKGIDFSPSGGTRLDIAADTYSSVTIEDDKFANGSVTDPATDACLIRLNDAGSSASTVNFLSDTMEGNGSPSQNLEYLVCDKRAASNISTVVKYTACLNAPGKCFTPSGTNGSSFIAKYNYINDIDGPGGVHSEWLQMGGTPGATTTPTLFDDEYNTFFEPSNPVNSGTIVGTTNAITSPGSGVLHFASTPSQLADFQNVYDFSTPAAIPQFSIVVNISGGTITLNSNVTSPGVGNGDQFEFAVGGVDAFDGIGPSAGVVDITTVTDSNDVYVANQWAQFPGYRTMHEIMDAGVNATTLNLQNNYIDPTGSGGCMNWGGTYGTTNVSGDTNLTDNSSITSTTGGTCNGHD